MNLGHADEHVALREDVDELCTMSACSAEWRTAGDGGLYRPAWVCPPLREIRVGLPDVTGPMDGSSA